MWDIVTFHAFDASLHVSFQGAPRFVYNLFLVLHILSYEFSIAI